MGSVRFFANIRPLESTHNNREQARLLQMPRTPAVICGSLTAIGLLWGLSTAAGPTIPAGDVALRHDIQHLADAGVIKGPISVCPLAWGPIPANSIERNFTDPFLSKWLRWRGPWDLAVHFGRFESARHIPNARFFGLRFNFRPLPSLEIDLFRTAQWCGDGRPCGFDTFIDLLLGPDNVGDNGIVSGDEPGNQLAGIDLRWAGRFFGRPIAVYGQFIGEDEAGGFPSHYLGQLGL